MPMSQRQSKHKVKSIGDYSDSRLKKVFDTSGRKNRSIHTSIKSGSKISRSDSSYTDSKISNIGNKFQAYLAKRDNSEGRRKSI